MTPDRPISFGGETLATRSVGDIHLAEARYAPGLRVARHEHTRPYLGFVLAGSCRERTASRCFDFEPLSLVVKAAGDRHSNEAGPRGTRYLLVEVGDDRRVPGLFDDFRNLSGGVFAVLAQRLLRELHEPDAASDLAVEGLVLELLAELSRATRREDASRQAPPWLGRAQELIRDLRDRPLSLERVAGDVGVHPSHLARGFRRHLGMTPGEYLREVRVEAALRLLAETRVPISVVARRAGFYDQSHLTRVVRQRTGMTPGRYRCALSS